MNHPKRKLKINMIDLESAFEFHDPTMEFSYFLDLETGEVEKLPLEHPDPGQLDQLIDRSTTEDVRRALNQLPARARMALVLRYYGDLSEPQIAAAMGVSRGSVQRHTARAAAALRPQVRVDGEDGAVRPGVGTHPHHRARQPAGRAQRGGLVLGLEDSGSRMSRIGKSELVHDHLLGIDEVMDATRAYALAAVSFLGS